MTRINAEDVIKVENCGDGLWSVQYTHDLYGEKMLTRLTKSEVQHLFEKGCVDV